MTFKNKYPLIIIFIIGLAIIGYYLLRPQDTPYTRAQAFIKSGKAAFAIPILEQLLKEHPDDKSVLPLLAQGYLSTDRLGEGRTYLDTAIKLRLPAKTLDPVVQSYVLYYQSKADYEEAEKLMISAQNSISPKLSKQLLTSLYKSWSQSEASNSNYDLAISLMEKALSYCSDAEPEDSELLSRQLATLYREKAAILEVRDKNYPEAIKLLDKSIACFDEAQSRMALGQIYSQLGKKELAVSHFQRVCQLDPDNLEARHRLVEILVLQKKYAEAQIAIGELLDKERSVESFELLAYVAMQQDNYAAAVRALEDAVALRADDPKLLIDLRDTLSTWSTILAKQGKQEESLSVKGHAERIQEMLKMLAKDQEEDQENADETAKLPSAPVISLSSSRVYLAKGSLTPEGELKIKNDGGMPANNLSLNMHFMDRTTKRSLGSVKIVVASPDSRPLNPQEVRSVYFSCPNIVKADHQLSVIVSSNGRLLKEFPIVKQN